ncbi:MAG: mechanosensitive ion channel [Ilumatobacter sp.]|nr:mechanosensitive ion channel domain-containing protein [Ilumatobacter sp.]MDJ0767883.1 mechanosensitive ion channel [Ilumatobacter sp.]
MPDWFDDEILGVQVEQYLGVGLLVVIAVVVHFVVVQVIAAVIRRRFAGEDLAFWNVERKRLGRALFLLTVGLTTLVGFPLLQFDVDVEDVVTQIAALVSAVAVVLVAYRLIDVLTDVLARRAELTDSRLDDSLVPLLRTTLRLFATILGILFVLSNLDVNITSLIAGLGLGGLAIALAAQDTVRNLLGGVTIFADKPFEVGDWVVVDGVEGTVEQVGFRSTRVRTFYNSQVTVPNGRLMDAGVDNMGRRHWRRYKTTLGRLPHDARSDAGLRRGHPGGHPGEPRHAHGLLHRRVPRLRCGEPRRARLLLHRRRGLERGAAHPPRAEPRHHAPRRPTGRRLRLPDPDDPRRRDARPADAEGRRAGP